MDANCNLSSLINDLRLLLAASKLGGDPFRGGSCNGWVLLEEPRENSRADT
jgi:hypothetical protein